MVERAYRSASLRFAWARASTEVVYHGAGRGAARGRLRRIALGTWRTGFICELGHFWRPATEIHWNADGPGGEAGFPRACKATGGRIMAPVGQQPSSSLVTDDVDSTQSTRRQRSVIS